MLPRIDSIRGLRLKAGLTQRDLARRVGVSASMISQIESGKSRPSYETAKGIFDGIAEAEGAAAPHRAGDLCSREIVKVGPASTMNEAIRAMRRHSISQVPVFDGGAPVGVVSEDCIMRHLAGGGDPREAAVGDVMEPVPPIVGRDTPVGAMVPLLRVTKCALVSGGGGIVGIVTASDALRVME